MVQDKNTPEPPGHISTRMSGMFSTFHLLGFIGRWGAWVVLLASLLITFNAWYFVRGESTKRVQARFDFRVKTIETRIYERLQAYEFLLRGGSGLFEASDEVTREEWRTYVTKLQINQYYPGIQGVGFSKQILPSEKEAHIRQIRGEGFPQYTIKPEGDRPEYTSIIFLEPFDWRNQRAFGYDMFSEPTRKEAMIRARDTGIAALSGKVTLVQETTKGIQAGFLIYLAVYRKGEPLETPEQRYEALIGYVYSPFRMNEFMKGILVENEGYVYLQIFDGEKPLKETQLYKSDITEGLHNHNEGHHFATAQSILKYAGHRWLLSFVSSKYFEESIETSSMNFILLLGITISLLLFGMVFSLTKSRSQAIVLANTTLDLEKANIELREEITERKQTGEALRESEHKLSTHLQNTSVGAISWDMDYKIVEWNPAAETIFGYTKEEALGKHSVGLLLPEGLRGFVEGIFQDLLSGKGGSRNINENITKDGRRIICDWYNTVLKDADGKVIGMTALVNDITERMQTEEALQKSEKQYRTLFEKINDAIFIVEKDTGRYLDANKAAAELTGRTLEELKQLTVHDITPEGADQRLLTIAETDGIKELGAVTYSRPDNTDRIAMLSTVPLGDNAVIGIARDITHDLEVERQLRQSQKMESIGTLAGGIAHDFNNILSPIIGYSEIILMDTPEDSPDREGLNQIYTSALRARSLVKQILTFARQGSGELMLMKMQPIVKEALKLIRSSIPTTIEIIQDINPDCGVIKADPTQIHQIVMNLTTNAYHAMEETGGKLKVSLKQMEFKALDLINPNMAPGSYACLTVADTGKGMDKNLTGKIFDPFFTTKAKGKGTGMGLSVVHGIVTAMGGAINVYSEPGKGTVFHVYLPVEKNLSEEQVTTSKTQIQGGTEQILLVDDEEAILSMEKRMLERLGYQVTPRTSSLEALEAFRDSPNKFDLVITDMAMPNMPGDRLSVELIKIRPAIPILLCTGFSEKMSEEKVASLGIKGFLFKPIMMKDLAWKIREVLNGN